MKATLISILFSSFAFSTECNFPKELEGRWVLKSVRCAGVESTLLTDATLKKGTIYQYLHLDAGKGSRLSYLGGCSQFVPMEKIEYCEIGHLEVNHGRPSCVGTCGAVPSCKIGAARSDYSYRLRDENLEIYIANYKPYESPCGAGQKVYPLMMTYQKGN